MILAELEVFTSRPIAPTRRLALGECVLPVDHPPGFGGILLGALVARFAPFVEEEFLIDVHRLMSEIEHGRRIAQPRLRQRFQTDRVGLQRSWHRLVGDGEALRFDLDESRGTPAQHLLSAIYAAGRTPPKVRAQVIATLRSALSWTGAIDGRLVSFLAGRGVHAGVTTIGDPVMWALGVLDLSESDRDTPSRDNIQQAFRDLLRAAHPDLGGEEGSAALRIAELAEARRILLS